MELVIVMQVSAMQLSIIAAAAGRSGNHLGIVPAVREYARSRQRVNRPAAARRAAGVSRLAAGTLLYGVLVLLVASPA